VQRLYGLSDTALIEMGDFVGGMLKYLRRHPVARLTIAGGFAKMTKLGQGLLDLHSRSGSVDHGWLASLLEAAGASAEMIALAHDANTAQQILQEAEARGIPLADLVAKAAWQTASGVIAGTDIALDVVIFARDGRLVGRCGP
jgi:cobalt-precorrin-5B (C1)-methyltransferase